MARLRPTCAAVDRLAPRFLWQNADSGSAGGAQEAEFRDVDDKDKKQ
jgi:hypothetical protein